MRLGKFARILLPGLLLVASCTINPVTGKDELALFAVSSDEEVGIGRKTFPQAVQQMGGVYPDAELNRYVQEVGGSLARLSERPELPWEFRVVNDSSPNAFALPGGFIAITRGLLVNLESEAALAAVLGHEIGHVTARHAVSGMQRGVLFDLGLTLLSGATGETGYGPVAQQAGALAADLLDKSYSREQERESDRLGIDYMVKARYSPQGAVQLQEFFSAKLEAGNQNSWLAGMFRTHPFSAERLRQNRLYLQEKYPGAVSDARYRLEAKGFLAATAKLRGTVAGYQLYDQALALEAKGDLRQAIVTYLQAATAAPDEALILTGLGMAYLKSDDIPSARLHLAKAVRLDGSYYQSRMGLGYALLQQKEAARAVAELEASIKLLPTLQGTYLLAEGYELSGRRDEALQNYRTVAKAAPESKLGRAAAGKLQALGGRQ
ncbi:MAG TPA: peptidase M48 [Desulfuromonas sp.]|nr:peptidase M48 [Desulfuromonas sp.]